MEAKDGGSAFPVLDSYSNLDGTWRLDCVDGGMTLRDYFATQALAGSMVGTGNNFIISKQKALKFATEAYLLADAMLEVREKP